MAVGVLVLWRTIAWLVPLAKRRTRSVAAPPLQATTSSPPTAWRRNATAAGRKASGRTRCRVLANGWSQDPVAHLSDGVILGAGEVALQRSETHFSVWATRSTWLSHSRVRGWGRHAESSTGEVSVSGWQEHGEVTWLVTSARLYGRARDGEIFSIWWACLDSLEVDLDRRPDRRSVPTAGGHSSSDPGLPRSPSLPSPPATAQWRFQPTLASLGFRGRRSDG